MAYWEELAGLGLRAGRKVFNWYEAPLIAARTSIDAGGWPTRKVFGQMVGRQAAALGAVEASLFTGKQVWRGIMPPYGSMQSNRPINPMPY